MSTKPTSVPKPEIEALGVEMGVDSSLPFTTPFSPVAVGVRKKPDEELQEVLRDDGEDQGPSVRQLVVMRRMDGQARALFRLLTLPVRSALTTCTFNAAEGGEKEAEFITNVFNTSPSQGGMSITFQRFMGQLLGALFEGFAAFEKVFWIPVKGPMAGKITLKKLAYRPSDTITFIADKQGGFNGFRQRTNMGGRTIDVFIEPEYAFYYAAQEEERKFYGVSFFQSAFYHYDKKVKLYFTAHLAAQRAAVGTRIGKVPPNASPAAKREFQQAMANLAFAQSIMVPEGFDVTVLNESSNFNFLDMVNHHNSQMSKSILAGFFDKDQGAGPNDSSLVNFAQPGDDMFVLMLRTIMDEVANQINHYIIPQLVDFNFPGGKYPTFTWGKLTDEQRAALSATFDKLANAQTITPEFMRALEKNAVDELGLEVDYDEVEEREAQEAAMAAQGYGPDGQPLPDAVGMDGEPVAGAGAPGGAAPGAPVAGPVGGGGGGAVPSAGAPAGAPGEPESSPSSDPQDWETIDDFEATLGDDVVDPEAPDQWNSIDDFEASMGYGPEEEEEPETEVQLTFENDIVALAQSLMDMAYDEELVTYGA